MINSENKTVCVTLPRKIIAQIDEKAHREKRTRSNMIARIIENHIEEHEA